MKQIELYRTCSKCQKELPITYFAHGGTAYKYNCGIMTQCKSCWKVYYKSWESKNRHRVVKYRKKAKTKKKNEHFFEWRASTWNSRKERHCRFRVTAIQLAHIWKLQRGRCALSGRKLRRDAHLDHIIPFSKGGSSEINNLRWLDPAVNPIRAALSDTDFIELCKDVIAWNSK